MCIYIYIYYEALEKHSYQFAMVTFRTALDRLALLLPTHHQASMSLALRARFEAILYQYMIYDAILYFDLV